MQSEVTKLLKIFPKIFTNKKNIQFPKEWYGLIYEVCENFSDRGIQISEINSHNGHLHIHVNKENLKSDEERADIWAICQTYAERAERLKENEEG